MFHRRKQLRLTNHDYTQCGAYFVTILAKNRASIFGVIENGEMILNGFGRIALKCWMEIPNHFPTFRLDAFCIMPDHMHGILIISDDDTSPPVKATHASPLPKQVLSPGSIGAAVGSFK